MKNVGKAWSLSGVLLLLMGAVWAQEERALEDTAYTVGTSTTIGADAWAYLLWQPSSPEILPGETYAIYRKSGPASSAAAYTRESVTTIETDRRVLTGILSRAERLGENLSELTEALQGLHGGMGAMDTANLLSSVLRNAIDDPKVLGRLYVLARQHPAVAMAMGNAYGAPLPTAGTYTFEIRVFTPATETDEYVVGRVTVSGVPSRLPAPTHVFTFSEDNERGNLNIKVRWSEPDALRLRSLEQYGFNVYRVENGTAKANGWAGVTSPVLPTPEQLEAAVGDNTNPQIRRANDLPILAGERLSPTEATDAGDSTTYFFADDNGRFAQANPGSPLSDGDKYYYFVTARDILGRDGLISAGSLAQVHDRKPPHAPKGLRVTNEFAEVAGLRRQFLRLTWEAPEEENEGAGLGSYAVYRWSSDREIAAKSMVITAGVPAAANVIGTVSHVPGTTKYQFDDSGAGSPGAGDEGKTFWYTVRAKDKSISGNHSGNSAPAFGVLRDHEGPAAPTGFVQLTCNLPRVLVPPATSTFSAVPSQATGTPRLAECILNQARGLEWAEFVDETGTVLARTGFVRSGPNQMTARYEWIRQDDAGGPGGDVEKIGCRVGMASGRVSNIVFTNNLDASPGYGIRADFQARIERTMDVAGGDCGDGHDPGSDLQKNSICGQLVPSADSREFRLYRSVDGADLTLIQTGSFAAGTVSVDFCDSELPIGPVTVCYYAQTLDANGNASALERIACVPLSSCDNLEVPTLLPLEAAGTAATPLMRVTWFGSPHGLTRFELYVSASNEAYASGAPASGLSADLASHPLNLADHDGIDFSVHETAQIIAVNPSATNATYSYDLPVELGVNYQVMVRAAGPGTYDTRCRSALGNLERFDWSTSAVATGIDVPWPARELPDPGSATSFHPSLAAQFLSLPTGWQGVGIRIGNFTTSLDPVIDTNGFSDEYPLPPGVTLPPQMNRYRLQGHLNPLDFLYANEQSVVRESGSAHSGIIFPVVVYRYEIPNGSDPVSNDVVQVTPLMEQIAYQHTVAPAANPVTLLHDPFIAVVYSGTPDLRNIFLLDRQPVISGAKYKYIVVRLDDTTKEIERVMLTNEVTIP